MTSARILSASREAGAITPKSGQMLSHYRLVEKIEERGIGEVYLAEDTHLDWRVALKLLPAALTTDHLKLERFEREAKVVASVNHPNIVNDSLSSAS